VPSQRKIMAVRGGNEAVARGLVIVMVDCLVWCFLGGGGGPGFNGGGGVSVVTPRYNESVSVLRPDAIVSISPKSQRRRGVCLLWCD
jgi:hypothetical protein